MSQDLHDALHRLADHGPHLEPDPDVAWRRGRRRRRGAQAGAVMATLAVLALVLGAVAWPPGRLDRPPVASPTADLGVPDRVHAVPDRFHAPREADLAIGPGAAAFVTPDGVPVVVGAADGAYHLLDLPGYVGGYVDAGRRAAGGPAEVALSPDGRQLAYGWSEAGRDGGRDGGADSGIRVVDLGDGSIRTVRPDDGSQIEVWRLVWSPDSTWVLWNGLEVSRTGETSAAGVGAAGTIGPRATVSRAAGEDAAGVSDTGTTRPRPTTQVGLFAANGTFVASARRTTDLAILRPGGTSSTVTVDGVTGGPADLAPVGWVGDEAAVVLASPTDEDDAHLPQLVLVGPDVPARAIGRVEGSPRGLSLATDLMSLDRPTVERPGPDWPWSTTRWVLTGLGVALLLGLGWVVVLDRRRRALGGGLRGMPSAAQPGVRDDRFGPLA